MQGVELNSAIRTHVGNYSTSTQATLADRADHPFEYVPHVALVAPASKTVGDYNGGRVRREVLMMGRSNIYRAEVGEEEPCQGEVRS